MSKQYIMVIYKKEHSGKRWAEFKKNISKIYK
jgi:hypothetical protein